MRFLLSIAALAALVPAGVSAVGCTVKTASTSSNLCVTADSASTEVFTGGVATISIPTFDDSLGILDAVYINYINAVYAPFGNYTNAGPGSASFTVVAQVNPFGVISAADGAAVDSITLSGIPGGLSTTSTRTSQSNPCQALTDAFSQTTHCQNGGVESLQFEVLDNTWASTPLAAGLPQIFKANYAVSGNYVAFLGKTPVASSGIQLAGTGIDAIDPDYLKSTAATWDLETADSNAVGPAQVTTFFGTSGTGVSLTNSMTFSLKLQVQVQYDYHVAQVAGDPQFAGFQGQSFQVHGAPESYFALISAPNYYVNARFDYLSTGRCDYNETACFTHPGTYMGLIYVGMKDANILVQAGPHATGFAGVLINDKPMQVGDRFTIPSLSANSHIHMLSESKLNLVLDTITLQITNSDLFVNFDLALTDKQLLTTGAVPHTISRGATPSQIAHSLSKWYGSYNPLHGLIGQTWRNVKYADNKLYQGDVTEYQLDKIVDHTFLYCVYEN